MSKYTEDTLRARLMDADARIAELEREVARLGLAWQLAEDDLRKAGATLRRVREAYLEHPCSCQNIDRSHGPVNCFWCDRRRRVLDDKGAQ